MAAFKNERQFIRKMFALGDRYDAIFLFLFLVYDPKIPSNKELTASNAVWPP